MTKYLIAAVLLVSLSAPAFAQAGPFYIMFDKKTNKCVMTTTASTGFVTK
jgi:hypothetical protein